MSEDPSTNETALCKSCGLCCDGTFFSGTPADGAGEVGDSSSEANLDSELSQPCVHFACDQGCGIYDARPHSCVKFHCWLLYRLRENTVPLGDAMGIVNLAKRQRDDILAAIESKASFLKPMPLDSKFGMVFLENRSPSGENRRKDAEVYLAYAALRHLIRKHFLTDKRQEEMDDKRH